MISSIVFSLFLRLHSIIPLYFITFVLVNPIVVSFHRVFPNDVMAVKLLILHKERAAMLIPQTNPSRIEFLFYANNCLPFAFKTKTNDLNI